MCMMRLCYLLITKSPSLPSGQQTQRDIILTIQQFYQFYIVSKHVAHISEMGVSRTPGNSLLMPLLIVTQRGTCVVRWNALVSVLALAM